MYFLLVCFFGRIGWDGSMILTEIQYNNSILTSGERGRTRYFKRKSLGFSPLSCWFEPVGELGTDFFCDFSGLH